MKPRGLGGSDRLKPDLIRVICPKKIYWTLPYNAPEVINRQTCGKHISPLELIRMTWVNLLTHGVMDVYSFGIITFEVEASVFYIFGAEF